MMKSGLAVLALLAGVSNVHAQSGDPGAGENTYLSECSRCHRTADRIIGKIAGDTPEAKSAWLESFLPDHHLRDMESKADLISYLVSL